jgi:hypothetical protein
MAVINSRGEPLPGFDSETGKAISLHPAEWRARIKGMKVVYNNFTMTIRAYEEDKLRYEIMATEFELR